MKIGFIGKGGTGKTSISSSLALYLTRKQKVLFIDADVNAHAHEFFGIDATEPLGEKMAEVSSYLIGNRKDIESDHMIGSTPPNKESKLITDITSDPFINKISTKKDNIFFLRVGTYTEEDHGFNCYHSKLMPLELLLHHIVDKDHETIIMDATAGVDILGTSLFMAFDLLFFLIEPTKKSISVLKNFSSQCESKIIPILNKVKDDTDIDFVRSQGIEPKITFKESHFLRLFEQDNAEQINHFIDENTNNFEKIMFEAKQQNRNYATYVKQLISIYKKNCENWYNKYFETDIYNQTQIDSDFLKEIGDAK